MEYIVAFRFSFFKMVNSYRQKILVGKRCLVEVPTGMLLTFLPAEVKLQTGQCGPVLSLSSLSPGWRASVTLDTALFVFGIHRVTLPLT